MRCASCHTESADGLAACPGCGAALLLACPDCAGVSPATAAFCSACGARLREPAPRAASPRAGELKQTTILFCDIVSSTAEISALDPEEAMERLQPALSAMARAVERFDGTIVRTMGDGLFALFGAPFAQEGHAILACRAALALQAAFPPTPGGLRLRIGLHTGEVVFGRRPLNADAPPDAHGIAIHLASRLQRLAEPGMTVLSAACEALARRHVESVPLGARRLKGIAEPVEIFRLDGLRGAEADRAAQARAATPLRGRHEELARLQAMLIGAEGGKARVVGIAGPAGTGKSRLCAEVSRWCAERGVSVFEARSQAFGHATPFQLALDLLRRLLGLSRGDEEALARRRIAERLGRIGPTFEADCSLLGEFLGYPAAESWQWLNAAARHQRLLEITRHLVAETGRSPALLVLEDLHWADAASRDFVAAAAQAVRHTRCLLVLAYRDGHAEDVMRLEHFTAMPLADMAADATEAMARDLVGPAPDLEDVRRLVAGRSGGNPFFVEELVRSMVANGVLVGAPGAYRRGAAPLERILPMPVQDVIASRIDQLPQDDRHLLQLLSVAGSDVSLPLLREIGGAGAAPLEPGLGRLCEAGLLRRIENTRGACYAFGHPLIRDVAYRTLLKARRAALHEASAEAIERLDAERLDEAAALLAYHREAAGQPLRAAGFEARAARWVGTTSAGAAIAHWRRVRDLLARAPPSPEADDLRILASAQIAWLGWREGLTAQEARPYLEEALVLARQGDGAMVPLLLFAQARLIGAGGGAADDYAARIRHALDLVPPGGHGERRATLSAGLCQAYGWGGLLREALAAADAALAERPFLDRFDRDFLGYSVEHWVVSLRGRILVHLARFEEAQASFDEMLALEPSLVDPTVRFISHLGTLDIAWCRGDGDLARRHARRIGELAARHGSPYLQVFRLACSGTAHTISGNFEAGARDFEAALAFSRSAKAALDHEADMLAGLAECHLAAGDATQAAAFAGEAARTALRLDARIPELRARIVAARAARAQGDGETGARALRRAAALLERTGALAFRPILAAARREADGLAPQRPPMRRTRSVNSRSP